MKSLWIFLGLGPLIVFIIEFFYYIQQWMSVLHLLLVLIVTYVGGAIPAALTCLVYESLAHGVGELSRAYLTALAAGFFVTAMAAIWAERMDWQLAAIGGFGAIAGFICSLLSPRAA